VASALAAAGTASGDDPPEAVLILESTGDLRPGEDPQGQPPRILILRDGRFFLSGTRAVFAGRLDSAEMKALDRKVAAARKVGGSAVAFDDTLTRHRLRALRGKPFEVASTGDPARAPARLKPLADLVRELSAFEHPTLAPFAPESYRLFAQPATLPGGCRPWPGPGGPPEAPQVVPAAAFSGWPTGVTPASVCHAGQRFAVTLRPLLPGEP
jgi:hypothetical protein